MLESFHSHDRGNGIGMHLLPTKKYKTNQLALYIRQPLVEEDYTKVALIPSVLKRGTVKYPTAQKIKQRLDDLYGASLQVDVQKRGEEQVAIFRLQIANENYLSEKVPLLEEGMELLAQIITQPLVEEGVFSEKHVELEKDILKRKLAQLKDDKIRYANKRCVEEMYKGERYGLFANGSLEALEEITAENLFHYYQQMITSHPLDFFVVGDVKETQVIELFDRYFKLARSPQPASAPEERKVNRNKEQVIIEETEIAQGKLHIGCRTHTTYKDDDYIALLVANGVFGGFSHSKLFRHVREKESLAYYVSSNIESHIGLMMIMSGIDFNHYDKTVEIIKGQLKLMQEGEITEEELSQTKAVLVNQIKESLDQPYQTIDRFYHGIVAGRKRETEQVIHEIKQTTVQDIQKVMQKVNIDTIYFLTSKEKEEGLANE